MRIVELRRRRPEDATVQTLARIYVPEDGHEAVIEATDPTELPWIEGLLAAGGVIGSDGGELHPENGEEYVAALPHSFRGSRLWAEEVHDDRGTPGQGDG